jgi:5-methyltetrahydrofolate--homocysteine methyltransferase
MIGLSGLITPSLDEMVSVAREMQRRKLELPLLIGGATTSVQHTAVKIAPEYGAPAVHVLDASRAVGVVSALLDPEKRAELDRANRASQQRLRAVHGKKRGKPILPIAQARENRLRIDWANEVIPEPEFLGRRVLEDFPLAQLVDYIDWTFFFSAWELKGRFPRILEHPEHGEAARELYANGRALLDRIIDQKLIRASGVYGFWPAEAQGEDVVLYTDASRTRELQRFPMLRQQEVKDDQRPNFSLADFVAPRESGKLDHVGAFAVTAGLGADALAQRFERENDDYSAILAKALADRLAEAFAEYLHARVRREWGYGKDESLSREDLIDERYRGIRPAFGYPACPDHSEKEGLFSLLGAPEIGIELTSSYAMLPAASVSGLYFASPHSRYFSVGRIGRDQVSDYTERKRMPTIRTWRMRRRERRSRRARADREPASSCSFRRGAGCLSGFSPWLVARRLAALAPRSRRGRIPRPARVRSCACRGCRAGASFTPELELPQDHVLGRSQRERGGPSAGATEAAGRGPWRPLIRCSCAGEWAEPSRYASPGDGREPHGGLLRIASSVPPGRRTARPA